MVNSKYCSLNFNGFTTTRVKRFKNIIFVAFVLGQGFWFTFKL